MESIMATIQLMSLSNNSKVFWANNTIILNTPRQNQLALGCAIYGMTLRRKFESNLAFLKSMSQGLSNNNRIPNWLEEPLKELTSDPNGLATNFVGMGLLC